MRNLNALVTPKCQDSRVPVPFDSLASNSYLILLVSHETADDWQFIISAFASRVHKLPKIQVGATMSVHTDAIPALRTVANATQIEASRLFETLTRALFREVLNVKVRMLKQRNKQSTHGRVERLGQAFGDGDALALQMNQVPTLLRQGIP